MADSNIKINITADDNASKKLKNLDDQVDKTGGGMGKLGKAAAVGGAALVALGVKSVMAFEDLGLTVGKFADATGTTTEQASRLIEVSGDIGISSDLLQSSIGKMSKQLGANEEAFKSYGIQVAKSADGTTDVNETFLNAVDAINAIPDPLKKAEAAAKVFGKGYQGMAELLGQSSDEIRIKLAEVSDAKVFDDKKVQDARDMREAFDSIVDAGQDLILTIGKSLAPVITKLAPILVKVVEAAAPAAEALGEVLVSALEVLGPILEALLPVIKKVADALTLLSKAVALFEPTGLTKGIKEAGESLEALRDKALAAGLTQEQFQQIIDASATSMAKTGDATKDLATLIETATARLDEQTNSTAETDRENRRFAVGIAEAAVSEEELAAAAEEAKVALERYKEMSGRWASSVAADVDEVMGKWDELTGKINDDKSWLDLQTSFDEVKVKAVEAWDAAAAGAADTEQKTRDAQSATDDQKLAVIDYFKEVLKLPPERATAILALIDQGKLDEAEEALRILTRDRGVGIFTTVGPQRSGGGPIRDSAEGGVFSARTGGHIIRVGEAGRDEAVVPLNSDGSIPGGGGGGVTIGEVHVHVQSMPSPNELISILGKYKQRNGPGALNSLSS